MKRSKPCTAKVTTKKIINSKKSIRTEKSINGEKSIDSFESTAEETSTEMKTAVDMEDLWKLQLVRIREMRKVEDAPVDTMGCHKLADPLAPPEVHRYQILLSLMLSSQTKDQVTSAAMMRLREHGCTIDSILNTPIPDLEKLLTPVGFYKKKAVHIQKSTTILKEKFNGDVPNTVEGLCSLPGVGPKMAHLVMQIAWGKTEGIAVDTHVHRIVNRLGWMKTKSPEESRLKLQEILPKSEWSRINPLLVGFGQQTCLPVKPKCDQCLCSQICPSSTRKAEGDRTDGKVKSGNSEKTEEHTETKKQRKEKRSA